MSGFGPNANWLRNIQATPGEEIVIGRERFVAAHRFLTPAEGVGVVAPYEVRRPSDRAANSLGAAQTAGLAL